MLLGPNHPHIRKKKKVDFCRCLHPISETGCPRKDSRYLHRGIATRSFERKFNLADHVEVVNAQLDNGLLKVSLVKEIPEAMKPRKIPVGSSTGAIESSVAV